MVSKVFEKIVYNQLYHYLDSNKLLWGCQSGFRSLYSTLTALLEATDACSVNIDNGLLNGVVFIDLTKAFNTINHKIILHKMSYLGVDQAAIKWFSLAYCSLWNKTKRNKTKRNETSQNETKSNETKSKETNQNETKSNETNQNDTKSNETNQNETK